MKKIFSWIVMLPTGFIMILFSISNRDVFAFTLWPLPYVAEIPIFVVVLSAIVIGVLWGFIISWLTASKIRRLARLNARKLTNAERENQRLKGQVTSLQNQFKQSQNHLKDVQTIPDVKNLPANVDAA